MAIQGDCEELHAEGAIRQAIRLWIAERIQLDGVKLSAEEIEETEQAQFEAVDSYAACNWLGCFSK